LTGRSRKGRGRDESHASPLILSYFQSGCRGRRHHASELTENLSMSHIVSEATTEDAIRYGLSDIDVRRLKAKL